METKKQSSSRIVNILKCKCPKCHTDYMYENNNPYMLKKLFDMKDRCEVCSQPFAPEPRYYDGAMFVSYGISVGILVSVIIAFNILFAEPNFNIMIGLIISLAIILSPLTLRISRSIWIHIFFKFDPNFIKKETSA